MNLTTRCPSCGTAFRVQPAQLSARGGRVRCGKCGNIFDGVKALVAEGAEQGEAAPVVDTEPSPQLGLFEVPKRQPGAANEDAPAPDFLDAPPPPKRRLGWALAATLALVALLAQAAYLFRTDIAAEFPELRPQVEAACALLNCELRLPRRSKLMAIESSELQADGRRDNVIVLNAVLRNQAPFAQEYPSLELTLTDERNEPVARRVLLPADYLSPAGAEQAARGLGPGADAVLRVFIDTTGLGAVGYRIYLFFP